jgi:hypothetical protein
MKQQSKFSQEQQSAETQHSQAQGGKEFSSAEELLRFDAAQTSVPTGIAQKLKRSAQNAVPAQPRTGWFKRLFN